MEITDEEFLNQLRNFLPKGAATPVFYKDGKIIDREKTLQLPCYENFVQGG